MLDQEGKVTTPEAYSRFRSALGKLSWYAQMRQDIRAWIGLLATQQAKPTDCTEKTLKAVLRYPYEDQRVVLRIPAEVPPRDGQSHPMALTQEDRLVCFSDASHAPLKSTGRRGILSHVVQAVSYFRLAKTALFAHMAKKVQAVEASKALAGQSSSMTDAAKRRCTTEESLQSWDEGEFISEQLTLEALKASEEAAESPGNIPTSVQEPFEGF
eukprot:s1348_g14.t1